jgi:hypothetical protein
MFAKARFPLLGSDLPVWINLVSNYAPGYYSISLNDVGNKRSKLIARHRRENKIEEDRPAKCRLKVTTGQPHCSYELSHS